MKVDILADTKNHTTNSWGHRSGPIIVNNSQNGTDRVGETGQMTY